MSGRLVFDSPSKRYLVFAEKNKRLVFNTSKTNKLVFKNSAKRLVFKGGILRLIFDKIQEWLYTFDDTYDDTFK